MKIEREKLLNDLQDFASRGDGVIIGSPGVGKTYVLKELRQRLKSSEIPHLLLRIDQLGNGTAETLQEELSYKGDLIEKLKSIRVSGKNAILLFDAFDAARDEQTRKRFLNLIRRAIQELVKWNIVVTVRTYDAKKSQELLDLFGSPDDTQHQSDAISCRHFTISPFNMDEIQEAFDQIGCPKSIYDDGSPDFKNILANPFNLWLLEKILKSSDGIPDFSQIHSEVQLLGLFWERRIENESSEHVLRRISRRMVKEHSLTVKVDDIYDNVDLDKPMRKNAWDKLQSDEILAKVSSNGQRIAFSHNILFDYAVSVLLIDDEPQYLERFVTEDPSRPLFLRPSLTYFFTRLWYYDSTSFWKAFWHIFPSDQSVHLRLVARLIPTSVIANEAHKIDQLASLLGKLQNGDPVASKTIARLLQSLRMLEIERDALWIDFFDQISVHLHSDFAWDLATFTSDILERATDANIKEACGRIGRRLLQWVWKEREASDNDWYNQLGSYWAVPLVVKTYYTNVEKSRYLLNQVLKLTKEEKFPIDFLANLTEHVDKIWKHDREFVALIYRSIFAHCEISGEVTHRGGTILSFQISRRQDYGLCQYRLAKHFPDFLRADPLPMAQAVIQGLNSFIIVTRLTRSFQKGMVLEDMMENFNFRGKSACFVRDNSEIWDAQKARAEPIKLADVLFEFIAELAMLEEPRLDSLLDVFRDEIWVAFFWKRLLKTAAQFPKVFAPRLFELCTARPIQISFETSYELGLFLEAAASEFTSDQLYRIERSILTIPKGLEDNRESLELRRDQLLAQIPLDMLTTDAAKKIREQMERENSVPENQPPFSFRTWSEPVTEEKRFQDKGIDTSSPENQELHRFFKPLDEFISNWRNDTPTAAAIRLIFPHVEKAYATTQNAPAADTEVIDSLWLKLTDCVAILSQVADDPEDSMFTFCRQLLLKGADHKKPEPNPYFDSQFNSSGYSPFPRHGAARGLLRLAFLQPDLEILDAIEKLANDPVPSVRMVTAMELTNVYAKASDRFWRIMDSRAVNERNHVVQEYLYFTLDYVVAHRKENEAKTTRIMAKLLEHTPLPPEKQGLSDPFTDLLTWLAIERENSWASKTIQDRFFKHPIQLANMLNRIVDKIMTNYVVPKHLETSDGRERTQRSVKWVSKAITVASNEVKELCTIPKEQMDAEIEKKVHDTYTVIERVITCLYYEVAHGREQSEKPNEEISFELRCQFYSQVKPLMEQVTNFALNKEHGMMFAPTAHHFMQVLTSFLSCDPKGVLHLAAGVVKSSEPFGYNLDSIAVRDVVEFVEIVLADYRDEVQDGESLENLLNLLDMFAKTGWTDALKLVWRLDEVFR